MTWILNLPTGLWGPTILEVWTITWTLGLPPTTPTCIILSWIILIPCLIAPMESTLTTLMLPLNLGVLQCFPSCQLHHHLTISMFLLFLEGFLLRLGLIIIKMGLVRCFLPGKQVQGTSTRFLKHKQEQDDNKMFGEQANAFYTFSVIVILLSTSFVKVTIVDSYLVFEC